MSIAAELLELGGTALVGVHGNADATGEDCTFEYVPASDLVRSETNQVTTDESGKAVESGNTEAIEFNGIFVKDYELLSPEGIPLGDTAPTVIVQKSAYPATQPNRNDVIRVGDTTYYLSKVNPQGFWWVLNLSLQAH